MEIIVCSIRDSKSELFARPFFSQSLGTAVRDFENAVKRDDKENNLCLHPQDFALYALGKFDDVTGMFKQESAPQMLTTAADVLGRPEKVKVSKV